MYIVLYVMKKMKKTKEKNIFQNSSSPLMKVLMMLSRLHEGVIILKSPHGKHHLSCCITALMKLQNEAFNQSY